MGGGRAQPTGSETLIPASPMTTAANPTETAGNAALRKRAADRALAMGFPGVAIDLYGQLLGVLPANQDEGRGVLLLALTSAYLEADRLDEAETALGQMGAVAESAPARLRRGLIAMARGNLDEVERILADLERDDLPANERAWWFYLEGRRAEVSGEPTAANRAYDAARDAAVSDLQRARFSLASYRSRWRREEPDERQVGPLRRTFQANIGERVGYDAAQVLAALLAALDRSQEAIDLLQDQLLVLPPEERAVRDDFRLLLGLISGARNGVGRVALMRLLADGADPEKQQIALRLVVEATVDAEARARLRTDLSPLLEGPRAHPIEADLLLYRAQLALAAGNDADRAEAERDASSLLERFPVSELRPIALGVLVDSSWERGRFRTAASYAAQARRELAEQAYPVRARLAVLQAEAFFRAGDYANAADAYAAALEEEIEGVPPGDLIFQEIVSRIRARDLPVAAERLNQLANDDRLDPLNRWQAEWNLTREMQARGLQAEAFARVNRLLESEAAAEELPVDLAARLDWLRARLALDAGDPTQMLGLAEGVRERLPAVDAGLRMQIASSLALMQAEAFFALNRSDEALAALQALRDEFPDTDAAVYSFIVEAQAFSAAGQLVDAQRLLTRLADDYPENRYAPYALYQAALAAESRNQAVYLEDAIRIIEERLVRDYPEDDMVFYARFKQGDLFRRLNQFGPARQIYETLVNDFPQHEDVLAAQMALADCLVALAGADSSLHESAATIYERLRDLPSAETGLRIEAGYKAGVALRARSRSTRAATIWWEVVNEFLVDGEQQENWGAKGAFWLAKVVLDLGAAFEADGDLVAARNAYAMIDRYGLPGRLLAAAEMERLGVIAATGDEVVDGD